MQARGVKMQDTRACRGVKNVRWKIEKRMRERIGDVVRRERDILTKVMVMGWYEGLEGKIREWEKREKVVVLEENVENVWHGLN